MDCAAAGLGLGFDAWGGLSSDMAPCLFPLSQSFQGQEGDEASPTFVDYAQLDAFSAEAFKGNPAVVCLLPSARSKEWMQNVAAEFNAPIAVFLLARSGNGQDTPCGTSPAAAVTDSHTIGESPSEFNIRYFTPTDEVPLCGHGSLASAYLMFKSNQAPGSSVVLHASTTKLKVTKSVSNGKWQGQMDLTLPLRHTSPTPTNMEPTLPRTLHGCTVLSTHEVIVEMETDNSPSAVILELGSAKEVESLDPCFEEMLAGPGMTMVTGKGTAESGYDFVSRVFAPRYGIPEDPVCGTAHCALASLWARKLEKTTLVAYQASKRGGVLELFVDDDTKCVVLRGSAVLVASGVLLC